MALYRRRKIDKSYNKENPESDSKKPKMLIVQINEEDMTYLK